jgi:hypothetical protein
LQSRTLIKRQLLSYVIIVEHPVARAIVRSELLSFTLEERLIICQEGRGERGKGGERGRGKEGKGQRGESREKRRGTEGKAEGKRRG